MPIFRIILFLFITTFSQLNFANVRPVQFATPPHQSIVNNGDVKVITGDHFRFHVLKDSGAYTATIVESAAGSVLIDTGTGKNPAFGKNINTYLTSIGKPVSVIITHDHSDHYGNLNAIMGIQSIYAQTSVAKSLNQNKKFQKLTNIKVTDIQGSANLYGLIYDFHTIDHAEADHNSYIAIDSAKGLFVGDLLYVDAYNYIREYTPLDETDELDNWISAIKHLKQKYADYDYVFVGHNGFSEDIQMLVDKNVHYLSTAQALIKGTQKLSTNKAATSVVEVVNEMKRRFPNYKGKGLGFALPGSFWPEDPGAKWF